MPKIFLIVWFKIDYDTYLLTNKNQENRDGKEVRFIPFSFHNRFSILSLSMSTVPSLCLVVLCAHRALPGSFDI
jgi:hypothetical protein